MSNATDRSSNVSPENSTPISTEEVTGLPDRNGFGRVTGSENLTRCVPKGIGEQKLETFTVEATV